MCLLFFILDGVDDVLALFLWWTFIKEEMLSRAANSKIVATKLSIFNFGCGGRSQIIVWCGGELGSNVLRRGRNAPL